MEKWIDLIKSMVRPFIIIWGFTIYGICIVNNIEIPALLAGLITGVTFEYFGERAYLRIKESGSGEVE